MHKSVNFYWRTLLTLLFFLFTTSFLSGQSVFEGKRVLIILKNREAFRQTRSIVESNGGVIAHFFPPRILHAFVTKKAEAELASGTLIDVISESPVGSRNVAELSFTESQGLQTWNNLFLTTVERHEELLKNDSDLIIPANPALMKLSVITEAQINPSLTSEYLIGSVSVGVIFVESNGALDSETETWTPQDKEDIIDQVYDGLDWWSQIGGYRAHLSWTYEIRSCTTRYEPISRTKEESVLWINDCMDELGYSHGKDYERARAYANDLRDKYKTDWSFVIFVVASRHDADGYFADKSGIAWAYVGGPYMVIPNKCNSWGYHRVWKVIAHETGHIFNALDEYNAAGSLHATALSDITNVQKTESDNICLMKSNDLFLCDHTREQIGWADRDTDGIYDTDHSPVTSSSHREKAIKEAAASKSPKMLFYENFSRKNEWFEDQNNYVRNDAYFMYDSSYGSSSWLEKDYYNFIASVRTNWIQGSAASGYGLMVRVKTATDGYIFFINQHGQFAFGKYVNANWKYLEPWTYSDAVMIGGENILKAQCNGNLFTLYINDQQVAEVFDDTFVYGNVGLAVLPGIQVSFDDLTIVAPSH